LGTPRRADAGFAGVGPQRPTEAAKPIEVVVAAKRPDFDRRKAPTRFELVYEALQASA
jgi:hypothetical protein